MTATLNPQYHPHKDALAAYAAGLLSDGAALLVASHLHLCPHCRQHLQNFEAKAGINLEDMPPEMMDVTCLENLLKKIDEHGPPACIDVTIPLHPTLRSVIPEPLQHYLGLTLDAKAWEQKGEGVFFYRAPESLPGSLRLMRYRKGATIHLQGPAMLLILEGSIRTLLHTHGPGDVVKNNWLPTLGRKAFEDILALLA